MELIKKVKLILKRLYLTPNSLLIVLLLFHFLGNLFWVKLNNRPPAWDEASNTRFSLIFYQFFRNPPQYISDFQTAFQDKYPPLIRLIVGSLMFLFGPNIKFAQFLNTLFFVGSILFTYKIAYLFFKDNKLAFLSSLIFSFFEAIYGYSRYLSLDIPLMFFMLGYHFFLFKSRFLAEKKNIILAAVFGLAMLLTKFQGIIYLFFIQIFIFLIAVLKKLNLSRLLISFIKLNLLMFIPLLIWIVPAKNSVLKYYFYVTKTNLPITSPIGLFNPITYTHYLKLFMNFEITPIIFFIFLGVLIFFIFKINRYKNIITLFDFFCLFIIIFYYLVFTLFPAKDMRFLFPIMPFVAILLVRVFLLVLKNNLFLRNFLISLIIFYSVCIYFSLSFGFPIDKGIRKQFSLPFIQDIIWFNTTDYPVEKYNSNVWPQEQIISDLSELISDRPINLVLIPSYDNFNGNNFAMYLTLRGIQYVNVIGAEGRIYFSSEDNLNSYLDKYSLFLYTPDKVGVFYQPDKRAFEQIQEQVKFLLESGKAKVIKKYFLPTGESIFLVKRI